MKTRGLIGFLLVALALALFAVAGDCVAAEGSSSDANPWLGKIRPGFSTGTTSGTVTDGFLDLMIPLWGDQKHLIYFNPQFRMNDAGGNEENLGLGYRGLYFNDQAILGVNLFYDTMLSTNDFRYDQFGVGIEALTKWIDLRANYYLPFGTTTNRVPGLDYYRFRETYIGWYRGYEEATEGFDGEVGFLVPIISNVVETRVYAGGYHYNSEVASDVNGWKTRLEVRPVDLFQVNMEVRDDNVRGTDVIVGAYLDIPFSVEAVIKGQNPFEGIEKHLVFGKGARPLKERMTDKVERDRDITTFARPTDKDIPDPIANNVIYVNADNPNAGAGTYSNPYKDIASVPSDLRYTDGAWVYVFSWDQRGDTYNNVHLQLVNNGVLWGQNYFYPRYRLGGDGPMPILDGGFGSVGLFSQGGSGSDFIPVPSGAGSVLTLAQNNEIMGLTIQHGQEGIYGQHIYRTNIHDNLIRDNGGFAVPSSLDYNTVLISNGFTGGNGIHIDNYNGPNSFDAAEVSGTNLSYTFTNNVITGNSGSGIDLRTLVQGTPNISNVNISNVFTGNTITNNTANGLHVSNYLQMAGPDTMNISDSTISNQVTRNNISHNGVYGDWVHNHIQPSYCGGTLNISHTIISNTFTDNTFSDNTGRFGWGVINTISVIPTLNISDSSISNIFTNNTVTGNTGVGLSLLNQFSGITTNISHSSISNTFTNNTITGNTAGLEVFELIIPSSSSISDFTNHLLMQGNKVASNSFGGVVLIFIGRGEFTADLGGGALGSTGQNSFYGNNSNDLINWTGAAISAKNNWWGQSTGPAAGQIGTGAGTVDFTPWLTTTP